MLKIWNNQENMNLNPQWNITSHLLEWIRTKKKQKISAGENVRKGNSYSFGQNISSIIIMEDGLESPQKVKSRATII